MSDTLNITDKKILRALQADASLPLKTLAENLAMSPSTVWRRIQELEKNGLIVGRVTLLDAAKAGLGFAAFVNVNIAQHDRNNRQSFEQFVANSAAILECFSVTGPHDYTVLIRTATVTEFEHFLMQNLLAHPAVATATSNIVLRQQKHTTALPI
ncbi:MAG: Lrp/AsnC family transcriptional regulator [bacterium]